MLGVFLDRESLDRGDLDMGALEGSLERWQFHDQTSPAEVRARIRGAAVVVSNKVMLDEATLEQARDLRLVCVAATGTNNVDLAAAARLGITVCNVRGYATPSVVQHVFALVLTLAIRLDDYRAAVREGRWNSATQFCLLDYPIAELQGRVFGVIGFGELGRGVARMAQAFGMEVLIAGRPGSGAEMGRTPLEELLARADVISIHAPLAPNTRNLIGAKEFAAMKRGAILINTARGGIVDERALADALRSGQLGGAGFDVLTVEPPVEGNVLLDPSIPNLIVTPHIAWGSRESRQRLLDQVVENVRAFLAGRPRHRVA